MNNVDSDLEEGEIPDDSPSILHTTKQKELPRRYILRENKEIHHKHKKDCRHAIRHHAKKLAKLKKTPIKTKLVHKPYKQCPHVKSGGKSGRNTNIVLPLKRLDPKNSHSHPLKAKDSPFKNNNIFRPITEAGRPQPDNILSKSDIVQKLESCSFSEMLAMYKAIRSQGPNSSVYNSNEVNHSVPKNVECMSSVKTFCQIMDVENNACNGIAPNCQEVKNEEEDEDEEELRRIALATCAKNVVHVDQTAVSMISNLGCDNVPVSEILNVGSACVPSFINTPVADNYEVVDMEVDEENENSPDTTSNLFIIDTKPASDFKDKSNFASKEQNDGSSDDDFEADILRAELIESMYRQKSMTDEIVGDEKPQCKLKDAQEPFPKPDKQVLQENSKSKLVRTVPGTVVNKSKRLIISLNAESSSDESNEDDSKAVNALPENPVASIEALISDIRQKSESSEKINNDSGLPKSVPKAVSCLSKAQQEEYNALMKILSDKKKVLPVPQEEKEANNKVFHSPVDDLKQLEKRLLAVTEALKKKKELLPGLSKEVTTKKQLYMKSKLTAQHLKEQYVAAEKVRRMKLDVWSKSCKNFEALKQSVSHFETKATHLQSLCSKVGTCIKGQSYSLPSPSTES